MRGKTLMLVDGANVLYRAFFAIPGLATEAGRPTNAVFGFIRILRQLERLWKPTHWAVVSDGGIPAERLARLETYKANRPPMPDALRSQLEPVREYLHRAGVPRIEIAGEEADDVMASMALRMAPDCEQVLIVSGDKDMMQTVDETVSLISPGKSDRRMGPPEVREKTGVEPPRIAEWLALTGDATDNVPGVPGVGPKTAARLLATCTSLAELLEHPERVESEKTRAKLVMHREEILRNLDLVRLRCGVADLPALADLAVVPPTPSRLLPFFEEMEFHSLAESMRTDTLF